MLNTLTVKTVNPNNTTLFTNLIFAYFWMIIRVASKAFWRLAKSYKMWLFFACGSSWKVKTNTGLVLNFWTALGNIFGKNYHTFIKGSTGFSYFWKMIAGDLDIHKFSQLQTTYSPNCRRPFKLWLVHPELSLEFWKQEFRTPIWQKVGVPLEKLGVLHQKSWSPTNLCIPYIFSI